MPNHALNYSTNPRGDYEQHKQKVLTPQINKINAGAAYMSEEDRKRLIENATNTLNNNYAKFDLTPINGFDGQVIVNSSTSDSPVIKNIEGPSGPVSRYYFTIHELQEVYYRTENALPLLEAHDKVKKENDPKWTEPKFD